MLKESFSVLRKENEALTNLTKKNLNQQSDISELKSKVSELIKHKERVSGNFSEVEERLDLTENQLIEKKAKLENLEMETAAAFNDTKRLLGLYMRELSQLNTTAQDIELKVEAKLTATRRALEDELKKVQGENKAFSTSLKKQEAEVSELKNKTRSKLADVKGQLKDRNHTVDFLVTKIKDLEERLEEKCEPKEMKKVAFSARIVSPSHVFTGPRTTYGSKVLIFDRVFTNVGIAYNGKTGIFTAPVKGVYQFTFMTFGYNVRASGAILMRNRRYKVSTWESSSYYHSNTASNTVILELNVRDCISIVLCKGVKIYSGVFSGFLIFPL
ncbi:unnamed protein product [Menidia menidia]|uniref:(Atlantic silverside) hypothetical protein n=1 Tax=Menidia menidia TaxID=238744 RepID=A0A8S4BDJ8_9TELE|nr:unnamed protein product [Menidia menidia]